MDEQQSDATIEPFRVAIDDAAVQDLHDRLARTRWVDDPAGAGTAYGVTHELVRDLVERWRSSYDWREHEAWINGFAQFTTTVDGARLHFVHERAAVEDAIPVVLIHGWPSTSYDYLDAVRLLTAPDDHGAAGEPSFHVVVPSLPGFGFSGPTPEVGWGPERIATALLEVMDRLGYDRFMAVGGDIGERITRNLALQAPERVIGVQLIGAYSSPPPGVNWFGPGCRVAVDRDALASIGELSAAEESLVEDRTSRDWSTAYALLQASRPQTLSFAMQDSPTGMLAWLLERFVEWTDWTSSPFEAVPVDKVLTAASIFWFTETFGSSVRIYRDQQLASGLALGNNDVYNSVPTGTTVMAKDTSIPIARVVGRTNNLVAWSDHDRGGHFPGLEEPDLVAADVRTLWKVVQGQVAALDR